MLDSNGHGDTINITSHLTRIIANLQLSNGFLLLWAHGSTVSLNALHIDEGVLSDIKDFLLTLVPPANRYHHEDTTGDSNGYAHILSGILGQQIVVPVVGGKLVIGENQGIFLLDFDPKQSRRVVTVSIISS